MPASTYIGNTILDCFLRAVPPALPDRIWVALHIGDPGVDGINEVSLSGWPGYIRQDAAGGDSIELGFTEPASKSSSNTNRLEYGVMDGPTAITITHFSLWDDETAGQMYIYGPLTESKTLSPTDECLINPARLQATVI